MYIIVKYISYEDQSLFKHLKVKMVFIKIAAYYNTEADIHCMGKLMETAGKFRF